MSIKGFIINGQTQKYDYEALDNKPVIPGGGGGDLTAAVKQALLQLASKVAYVDAYGSDYYSDLYEALYGTAPASYTVINNLTNVTNSNTAISITSGNSYTGTLSCAANYEISSVSVTMGGNDVTGTVYSSGTISIPSVTGNIVITAVATQRTATLSSISAVFAQGATVIYDTDSLDTLKQYLTVTATWSDSSTSTVSDEDYTLSGTLTVGTSTITVSYGGETDTFTVTVTMSRETRFGTFTNGRSLSRKNTSSQGASAMPMYSVWVASTSARATIARPFANDGYTFTVTDSTKYNLAVYGITDPTPVSTTYSNAVNGEYFQGDSVTPSFAESGTTTASYVMVSLKKMDNSSFTTAELANGAEAVFTYTTT